MNILVAEKLRDFQLKCNDPKLWKELAEQKLAGKKLTVFLWYPVEWALAKDRYVFLRWLSLIGTHILDVKAFKNVEIQY